ncbi:hypothetical protein [Plastoroseomonas arctica]|uniref:Uncharacterized protein n=1 Tax=Plastoroseomonas arctica TaxID=1509237 RepID=A0AAF1JYC7_9PROT|nr:hypothetical protein [Plastoroseomonas arctica]MBR0656837.1 hypothetical protein [Plastoroseomonas arctica]
MASSLSVVLCALLGLLLWGGVGWLLARRLGLLGGLSLPLAPALGWAVQNALALALAQGFGLSLWTMLGAALAIVLVSLRRGVPTDPGERLPAWFYAAAALVALAPAVAILPKFTEDGVLLGAAIYDHAKIALTAEFIRHGIPPINPVFAEPGTSPGVAYYYLWQFGAAQLGRLTGSSAWEADAASTWFTGFATLCLMAGIAFHACRSRIAPVIVLLACATASLRPTLAMLFGEAARDHVLLTSTGLGGWLYQTSWAPHHMASAGCTVLAALLLARLAVQPSVRVALVLALVVAAGFGSSIWVGGVTFALAGGVIALALLPVARPGWRDLFVIGGVAAALGAAALVTPMALEMVAAGRARGGGAPIILDHVQVLGNYFPQPLRRILDAPGYWLVLLVVEFPVAVVGTAFAMRRWRHLLPRHPEASRAATALALLALCSLLCGWVLVSTAGENNDLGWRAVLPAILVLTAAAGAAVAQAWRARPVVVGLVMLLTIAAAAPDGASLIAGNVHGHPSDQARQFAQAPAMWEAVRRHAAADDRVINNPRLMRRVTPWEVNISWALLADRRSCFAGHEMALAFVAMLPERRLAIWEQMLRVFDGVGTAEDVTALATQYGCRVVLLTAADAAWSRDPFADDPRFRLAEARDAAWRIYVIGD